MLTPSIYQVKSIVHETADVFTLGLQPESQGQNLAFRPGQFNMLYDYGYGEAAISISGNPLVAGLLTHTIRAVGPLTKHLQTLNVGEQLGVRGPFGSCWPIEHPAAHLLVIAGGIGLAPLRPLFYSLESQKSRFQSITLLHGARTPQDLLYLEDLSRWNREGIKVETTVDFAGADWQGEVGVVTSLIKKNLQEPKDTLVFICGPEAMIKFSVHELLAREVSVENIFVSLERNMQCAVGFCGRCQYGPYFLCKDGPIFSYAQLQPWLMIREL